MLLFNYLMMVSKYRNFTLRSNGYTLVVVAIVFQNISDPDNITYRVNKKDSYRKQIAKLLAKARGIVNRIKIPLI